MELAIATTTTSGTRTNVFKNSHGFGTEYSVTIDMANIDAADYASGYLAQGFPLGKITADSTYAEYKAANVDGTETLECFLRWDYPVTSATAVVSVSVIRECHLIEANLPVAVDAAGKTDVANRVSFF